MKHLCFFNSTSFWGGGEKLFLDYAARFQLKGYEVTVACSASSPLEKKALNYGLQTLQVKVNNFSFLNPLAIKKVSSALKASGIDTIFFITSEDVKFGGLAAHRAKIARVVYLRGLAVKIKPSLINKYVFTNCLTHFISNSNETKQLAIGNFNSRVKEKSHIIYHGIDIPLFDKQATEKKFEFRDNPNQIIIGNAGRLTKQKGQLYLIEIAKRLKEKGLNFKIVIAGTGELEKELQQKIKEQQLEAFIEMLGFVSKVPSFMTAIDIFALTSIWEGFGFVITEAMAASKPVVAFNRTSNPEVITDGETGVLVDYPDVNDFANQIEKMTLQRDWRKTLGTQGRKSLESRFDIHQIIDELEDHLTSSQS